MVRIMKRSEFRFLDRLRVRWAEIDAQKIVFNAHYLMYFDTAIAGYWRALALPYAESDGAPRRRPLRAQGEHRVRGLGALRRRARYRHPLRAHRQLVAAVRRRRVPRRGTAGQGRAGLRVRRSGDADVAPVPQELRGVLEAFEAGKPMLDVRVGAWSELGSDAQRIRSEVFVERAAHPGRAGMGRGRRRLRARGGVNRFGMALATGRLLEHVPGVAKIGRMAVVRSMRGSGVGRAVLDALMKAARERGYREARAARAAVGCAVLRARRLRRTRPGVRGGRHSPRRDGRAAL